MSNAEILFNLPYQTQFPNRCFRTYVTLHMIKKVLPAQLIHNLSQIQQQLSANQGPQKLYYWPGSKILLNHSRLMTSSASFLHRTVGSRVWSSSLYHYIVDKILDKVRMYVYLYAHNVVVRICKFCSTDLSRRILSTSSIIKVKSSPSSGTSTSSENLKIQTQLHIEHLH